MSGRAKRITLFGATCLALVIALVMAQRSGPGFRSESAILFHPYTNYLFSRSFESSVIATFPGILRLSVVPSRQPASSGQPALTNGVAVFIIASGATAENAEKTANNAARTLYDIVSTNYSLTGGIFEQSTGTRPYSYFHDTLQPGVRRLLNKQ